MPGLEKEVETLSSLARMTLDREEDLTAVSTSSGRLTPRTCRLASGRWLSHVTIPAA
jgi:hypothetical protein